MIITIKKHSLYDSFFHKLGIVVHKLEKRYTNLKFKYDWNFDEDKIIIHVIGEQEDVEKFIMLSDFQKSFMSNPMIKTILEVEIK